MYDKGGFLTFEFSTPEGGLRTIRKTELGSNDGILKNPLYTLHEGPKRHNICKIHPQNQKWCKNGMSYWYIGICCTLVQLVWIRYLDFYWMFVLVQFVPLTLNSQSHHCHCTIFSCQSWKLSTVSRRKETLLHLVELQSFCHKGNILIDFITYTMSCNGT